MIFVTVGTQEPFDRLIRIVDELAATIWRGEEVVVQSGASNYRCTACTSVSFVSPAEFTAYVENSRFVVAHAGMGTIITAVSAGKPIVVVPRLSSLSEHRNDHQLATAKKFKGMGLVSVASDADSLREALIGMAHNREAAMGGASPGLIASIREFAGLGEST